jgi:cell division transport system ATP-binding protein
MVNLSGISKTYQNGATVLDQVTLNLKKGEFLYLVGGSGAGKSSLLRILATEEDASAGIVSLFGYKIHQSSSNTIQAIRRSLGYVPQDIRLISDLTVFDNIALSLSLAGHRVLSAQAKGLIVETMDKLGLMQIREKLAGQISGGEAQRVAVARALVRQPELIIADEPTGAQDQNYTWMLMDLFLKANLKGATVVIATHDREIVRRVRKRCAILKGGRLVLEEGLSTY